MQRSVGKFQKILKMGQKAANNTGEKWKNT
jgi:hypothetical protein